MNLRKNYAEHWQLMILFPLVVLVLSCLGCVHLSPIILTQSEMLPIIPKGATYHANWDGKEQDFIAEQDRIAIPKGNYLELQKQANNCQ